MDPQRQQFLIFRIRAFKDPEAFDALYDEHAEKVRRYLRSRLPSQQDTEDALTSTFLQLWNYLQSSEVQHLSGLLFTIARNVIATFYRGRVEMQPLDAALAEGKEPQAMDSAGKMEAQAELVFVRRFLARLPKEQREVVNWKYFEDVPIEEIAKRIDKTPNATRVMIHRAMKTLRALWEE